MDSRTRVVPELEENGRTSAPREASAGARRFNQDLKRAGGPSLRVGGDQWEYLLRLVWSEYAYCTMYGVNIVDGSLVSCANIQRSLTFGPEAPGETGAPAMDEYWRALQGLCRKMRNGSLAELRFSQGRPVSARTNEGGRRFRRHLMRPDDRPRTG